MIDVKDNKYNEIIALWILTPQKEKIVNLIFKNIY